MASITPILVRTFGRTGSTLLMQILATDKRIVFERQYPFEHRYLTYVYNMARVAGLPAMSDMEWSNDILFRSNTSYIGSLPYNDVACFDKSDFSLKSFLGLWEQISQAMREKQGFAASDRCYYAEKAPHPIADFTEQHMDTRSIYLLRDPRDEMVSIKSFNAKRGFYSFGYLESDTDLSYATKMCRNRRVFMQNMLSNTEGEKRFYLRYEDLVSNGKKEVKRLSDWLGVNLSIDAAKKDKEIHKLHMTSRNFEASVERWRTELSGEVQELFTRELGKELTEFGYSL